MNFRIRRIPHQGYRVYQRIGSGWEAMCDLHRTRADARAWIDQAENAPIA
jgi:hypothetical protein